MSEQLKKDKGLFIAIEGSDGCGKKTQSEFLSNRLRNLGSDVLQLEFPRYNKDSSFFVRKYLNGEYGSLNEVSERQASILFALDRFDASSEIKQALKENKTVVVDRFVASNLAHQGSKIDDLSERKEFYAWCTELEFDILKIPRPNLNIVLNIESKISEELLKNRSENTKTDLDIHEQDQDHQKLSRKIYAELCKLYPQTFTYINCINNQNQLMSVAMIHEQIWHAFKKVAGQSHSYFKN